MNTTLTTRLVDALRALLDAPAPCDCGPQGCGTDNCGEDKRTAAIAAARGVLAEYDSAPPRTPRRRYFNTSWRTRWTRFDGDGDVRGYRPARGWEATAVRLDAHPTTFKKLPSSQWWIYENREDKTP